MKKIIIPLILFGCSPKHQQVQTVEIIQAGDTSIYTGIINETHYYVKIFDTTGSIRTQVRGNFKINYIKTK